MLAGALGACGTGLSQAALTFILTESGGNVNYVMTGSINLNALGPMQGARGYGLNAITPSSGFISTGDGNNDYFSISASKWAVFGTGSLAFWDFSSGDLVVLWSDPYLGLPVGYVSEAPLSASGYSAGSLASLGITPGTYTTTFSNEVFSDTVTVIVNPVPEFQSSLLAAVGLGMLSLRRKR